MAQSITDKIADLKEKRAAAILAQLPKDWGDTPVDEQRRKMLLAEHSDAVRKLDDQLRTARVQQLQERLADDNDPFDDDELDRTIAGLQDQAARAYGNIAMAEQLEKFRSSRKK